MAQEQNYWPGFVDALSNVVLTLLFVLVVFILALVLMSNRVERKAQEMIEKVRQEHEKHLEPSEVQDKLEEIMKELEKEKLEKDIIQEKLDVVLEKQKEKLSSEAGKLFKSDLISFEVTDDRIILKYPPNVSLFSKVSNERFLGILTEVEAKFKKKKVLLESYVGNEVYTVSRRLAYYRALDIRNELLRQGYVHSKDIKILIMDKKKNERGRVEIIFK